MFVVKRLIIYFLALMIESLRTTRVQACDNEKITLNCPRYTHILIENAFYGRVVPSVELCPNKYTTSTITNFNLTNDLSLNHQKLKRKHYIYEDTSCDFSDAHRVKI